MPKRRIETPAAHSLIVGLVKKAKAKSNKIIGKNIFFIID
jgi:hypothetical protein